MSNEQFEGLVRKLETEAEKNPGGYRFKVLLLTGLGYGYVLFFLALLLVLLDIRPLYFRRTFFVWQFKAIADHRYIILFYH